MVTDRYLYLFTHPIKAGVVSINRLLSPPLIIKMKKQDKKYIEKRLEWLKDAVRELKQVYRKTKILVLDELYYEIDGDIEDIKWKLKSSKWGKENGNRKRN